MTYRALFCRGLLIVTLTAFNVKSISHGAYVAALLGGFGISFVWFGNSRTAAHSDLKWAREVYAAGAAIGTVFGMWLGGKG
jgi:Na+/glutamate symporter